MPLYSFRCTDCGHADTEYGSMQTAVPIGERKFCPHCGLVSYRRQADLAHTDMKDFHTAIEMHSIGMNHDDDIKEFMRRAPDVEVSLDQDSPNYGMPIARNRKQKLQALKASGFAENS